MEFNIIALTEQGVIAIKQHLKESLKESFVKKQMLKQMGYSQIVTCEEPYTLRCEIGNKSLSNLMKPKDFIKQVEDAFTKNGAKKNKDYTVEVNK